ncbi:CoA-binding protein [Cupriavidus basilensis]
MAKAISVHRSKRAVRAPRPFTMCTVWAAVLAAACCHGLESLHLPAQEGWEITMTFTATAPQPDRAALSQLLEPASIAIIGASRDTSRIGGVALDHLQRLGYRGTVYPVNPRYAEIAGLACYPDVESLPKAPDVGCARTRRRRSAAATAALPRGWHPRGDPVCLGLCRNGRGRRRRFRPNSLPSPARLAWPSPAPTAWDWPT